jgi:hypothetical protein
MPSGVLVVVSSRGAALLGRQGGVSGRWARYAFVVVLLAVGIINWRMTVVMLFYGAIFAGALAAWRMLARR